MKQDCSVSNEYGSISGFRGDMYQTFVVCKNEMKKFFRGSRILLFSVLIIAVVGLMTFIPYLLGNGYQSKEELDYSFIMFIPIIVELAVVLFTATSIVSEFEERTALVLFTKPIKKSSIFLGKLIASLVVVTAYTVIYYLYVIVLSFVAVGGVQSGIGTSLIVSLLGIFGCTGIAMLMSSMFKKGSTASIMTFVVIMLLISIAATMLFMAARVPMSWDINNAFNYCCNILNPSESISSKDLYTACGVLACYGLICNTVAYVFFSKRDF